MSDSFSGVGSDELDWTSDLGVSQSCRQFVVLTNHIKKTEIISDLWRESFNGIKKLSFK